MPEIVYPPRSKKASQVLFLRYGIYRCGVEFCTESPVAAVKGYGDLPTFGLCSVHLDAARRNEEVLYNIVYNENIPYSDIWEDELSHGA